MARVLIIDDDHPTRLAIRTMLELDGHEVAEASDGDDGLKLFQQRPTDLVIMDLLMPNKNGLDTIVELKKTDSTVKIIAISGSGLDYLSLARDYGAQKSLGKPFDRQHLLDTVNEVLYT